MQPGWSGPTRQTMTFQGLVALETHVPSSIAVHGRTMDAVVSAISGANHIAPGQYGTTTVADTAGSCCNSRITALI